MTIEVCTLAPEAHLDLLETDRTFMALVHAVEKSEVYREFFKRKADEGCRVILDNSVIELGRPRDITSLIRAAEAIHANEIVLPDQGRDKKTTLDLTRWALRCLGSYGPLQHCKRITCMIAPQGATPEEWTDCARLMLKFPDVRSIGISYLYTEMFGSRIKAIETIWSDILEAGKGIHLLGCTGDPIEIYDICQAYPVESTDSTLPCLYAKHGIVMMPNMPPRPARDIDFIGDRYEGNLLQYNVDWWRRRCTTGQPL